jgi:hypothetical protein
MSFCSWKDFVVASSAGHSVCFGPRIIDHCWQLSPPSVDKPVGNLIYTSDLLVNSIQDTNGCDATGLSQLTHLEARLPH